VQQISASPLGTLIESWVLALQARNVSISTISVYRKSAELLVTALAERGVTRPEQVEKRHVEEFIAHLAATRSAATASVRYRALQQWFSWMADEDEIPAHPMARMRPPIVPEQPVPVLEPEQITALLAACEGKEFADRRDAALVHLFLDTGVRLAELTGATLDDVDLSGRTLTVLGKGRRGRTVAFGTRTARALDRYLRSRAAQASRAVRAVAR
jgi:site-specific recombinase XerD